MAALDLEGAPPSMTAIAQLAAAELALRALRIDVAAAALDRARIDAVRAGVPALQAEIAEAAAALQRPAARRIDTAGAGPLRLSEVADLLHSDALVVDACHHRLHMADRSITLARRPVLFALARALAEAWPADVDRDALIAQVFRMRQSDDTLRARLRVEIGRLRRLAKALLSVDASPRGYVLVPRDGRGVAVIAPPIDGEAASMLALLSDGAAWSTSALALALGASQRTVQRALVELEAAGRVRSIGRGRAQRWLAPPLAGFTTILLLPAALAPE